MNYLAVKDNNFLFSKIILSLAFSGFAILDGIHRAVVIAGHAHRAVAVPFRMAVLQGDVFQGTALHALAAMDAGLGGAVLAVVGGVFVEALVDQVALQPGEPTYCHLRKMLPLEQPRSIFGQRGLGGFDLAFVLLMPLVLI